MEFVLFVCLNSEFRGRSELCRMNWWTRFPQSSLLHGTDPQRATKFLQLRFSNKSVRLSCEWNSEGGSGSGSVIATNHQRPPGALEDIFSNKSDAQGANIAVWNFCVYKYN
jgi:hypothetical protein